MGLKVFFKADNEKIFPPFGSLSSSTQQKKSFPTIPHRTTSIQTVTCAKEEWREMRQSGECVERAEEQKETVVESTSLAYEHIKENYIQALEESKRPSESSTFLNITMTYSTLGGATHIAAGVTTVDCQKQVRSWRLIRALIELLIPTCNCFSVRHDFQAKPKNSLPHHISSPNTSTTPSSTIITGTIFGYRHGKVKLCIQTHPKSTTPILLLELALPTSILAREMQGGLLRIALESTFPSHSAESVSLLSTPVWTMYCNGRKVGFAVNRQPAASDMKVLRRMGSVIAGAGIVCGKEIDCDDDIIYLRGNFERICGSSDAESFHLIDPDGCINQDLSIFFLRSL
ncbi:hypothetical protein Ancab_003491 [Ancistrocladus abbreviatus]